MQYMKIRDVREFLMPLILLKNLLDKQLKLF